LPSVASIVARHREALGRLPADSARWSGSVSTDGVELSYETIADQKGRFRQSLSFPLATRLIGNDGISEWQQDENGNVQVRPALSSVSMSARLVGLNQYFLGLAHSATLVGITPIDEQPAYELHADVLGENMSFYVDVKTALLSGADSQRRSTRYRAYKRFDGVPVPTEIRETSRGSTTVTTVNALHFGVNVRAAAAVPPPRAPSFPAKTEVRDHFESPQGLIALRVILDGKPLRVLLDSGSSGSVIDLDAAKQLGLRTAGVDRVQGASMLFGSIARAQELNIDGIAFRNFVMRAVPLRLPSALSASGIQAVLGYDVFAALAIRLNYARKEISFLSPAAFSYSGSGVSLPLDIWSRLPRLDATLGASDTARLIVDTGNQENLVLYQQFADLHARDFRNGLDSLSDTGDYLPMRRLALPEFSSPTIQTEEEKTGAGAGGDIPIKISNVTRFHFADYTFLDVPAHVVLHPTGAFTSQNADGLVGVKTLAFFKAIYFDYPHKRLIVER
jgi:hypothetical protein